MTHVPHGISVRPRMRPRRAVVLVLVGCAMASGCRRPPSRAAEAAPDSTRLPAPPTGTPSSSVAQFDVPEVAVAGSLRPGDSIRVDVAVRARIPTTRAVLRVILPEAEMENRHDSLVASGRPDSFSGNLPLKGEAQWTFDLDSGQTARRSTVIRVEHEGYYRLYVHVRGEENQEMRAGRYVQNVAVRERWLWIHERGGRVTESFDTSVFGFGEIPNMGRLRRRPR